MHRSYLVNINKIKEVVPWFKSSDQLRMDDKKHTEIPASSVYTGYFGEAVQALAGDRSGGPGQC